MIAPRGRRDSTFILWALAGAFALTGLLLLVRPSDNSDDGPQPPTATLSQSAAAARPAPSPNPTSTPRLTAAESDAGREPAWRAVVEGFAVDFTRDDGDMKAWVQRLSQWVTPQLADGFSQTAGWERPSGSVETITPENVGDHAVDVIIRYDTGLEIWVRAENSPDGWLATAMTPVDVTSNAR